MVKSEFVAAVAKETALTPKQVSSVLASIENVAAAELKATGSVRIPGLVTIKRMERGERIVRNPKTREEFVMGACVLVKAKPVTSLADRIKEENPIHA